jgi:hypothetical protein
MKICVHFFNQPVLSISVDATETGKLYFDITRKQNLAQTPFYRDSILWSTEYMIELAQQAKIAFDWDWLHDSYDLSVTTQLHKDLENSIGKLGFAQIPEEYDSLLYDLHHCLHAIQHGTEKKQIRSGNFQIEWLTDNSMALPDSFEFVPETNFGDLILINPYVGHNPLQIYNENDFGSLSTTCKFHDIIKPGIVLCNKTSNVSKQTIFEKFQDQDPDFVCLHGAEKIKYYSGSAVVGGVDDVSVLKHLQSVPTILELKEVTFHD